MDAEATLLSELSVPGAVLESAVHGRHTLNYLKAGQGPALVLLHGGTLGWGQWYPNISVLAQRFTVYALDLPGGGRSSLVDFPRLDLAGDFLEPLSSFITSLPYPLRIIGSSFGGWLAIKLALVQPARIKRLVIADTLGLSTTFPIQDKILGVYPIAKFLAQTIFNPIRENRRLEKLMRSVFYNSATPLSPTFIQYFYETMKRSHNVLMISRLAALRRKLLLIDQLPLIKTPTLIMWGEQDKLLPLPYNQPSFSLLPHGQSVIIAESGHMPSLEQSTLFNAELLKFL